MSDFVKAIKRANSRMVASLLKNGSVDVNARLPCHNNPPPLVLAARRGHVEIVEMLLKAGVRIDDTDERGRTACHAAVLACSDDVMDVLLRIGPISKSAANGTKLRKNVRFVVLLGAFQ